MAPTYDDVEVGTELPAQTFPIRRADLVRYAGASGDFNVIHWNERVAQSVGLPDVIAHGMFTMALAARVVTDWAGDPGASRRVRRPLHPSGAGARRRRGRRPSRSPARSRRSSTTSGCGSTSPRPPAARRCSAAPRPSSSWRSSVRERTRRPARGAHHAAPRRPGPPAGRRRDRAPRSSTPSATPTPRRAAAGPRRRQQPGGRRRRLRRDRAAGRHPRPRVAHRWPTHALQVEAGVDWDDSSRSPSTRGTPASRRSPASPAWSAPPDPERRRLRPGGRPDRRPGPRAATAPPATSCCSSRRDCGFAYRRQRLQAVATGTSCSPWRSRSSTPGSARRSATPSWPGRSASRSATGCRPPTSARPCSTCAAARAWSSTPPTTTPGAPARSSPTRSSPRRRRRPACPTTPRAGRPPTAGSRPRPPG